MRLAQLPTTRSGSDASWRACEEHFRALLGNDAVLVGDASAAFGETSSSVRRAVPMVLRPASEQEVAAIVRIAREHDLPLYPVSTGKNWGYGSAAPVVDGCAIVDLSRMNRIIAMDTDIGVVTVQPGVTQGQLADYLNQHRLPFMVPVTGAGPTVSLLGNALERGYGITPYIDHFDAITSLAAVLPDGAIYRSAHAHMDATTIDRAYKWGLGPYLDGLFAQGSLGIVTEVSIALARRPQEIALFMMDVHDDSALWNLIRPLRMLMSEGSDMLGGINVIKRERLLSMLEGDELHGNARRSLPAWMVVGAVYGTSRLAKAMREHVRERLHRFGKLRFFTRKTLERLEWLSRLPLPGLEGLRLRVRKGLDLADIMGGYPREVALPLAYGDTTPRGASPLDPQRDGCGLLWYSPLVPLKAQAVIDYVDFVTRVCAEYGFPPLITLTLISDRCCDSTLPLVFDRGSRSEAAENCLRELIEKGQAMGVLPYRLGVTSMQRFTSDETSPFWRLVGQIKQAVDPSDIIAPGRYAPLGRR